MDITDRVIGLAEDMAGMKVSVSRIPIMEGKLDSLIAAQNQQKGMSKFIKYFVTFAIGIFGGHSAH